MMGGDEEWMKAAMSDDTMVAELLLLLNQATSKQSSARAQPPPKPALSIEWSVRQRRSKSVTVTKTRAPRASPTTPLSWSGATSHSGGGGGGSGGAVDGGSEESSKPQRETVPHPNCPGTTRSNKVTNEATASKRPRRKKTLAELKEDEVLLLKERRQLKKELAALRVNMDKQKEINENLKRMKLDLQSQPAKKRGTTISVQEAMINPIRNTDSSDPPAPVSLPISQAPDASMLSSPGRSCSEERKGIAGLVLPDLNLPFEEDCSTEVLCVAS